MRFDGGRLHPQFDLNGGQTRGPTVVSRAAYDPVRPPQEPAIVKLLDDNLCVCRVENGGYAVRNPLGDLRMVKYGAPLSDWKQACEELMAQAMEPSRVV